MSWYYVNNDGFTVGPKTVSELKPLYASKTITESTFIWNGTTVDTWTALKKVSSVYGELAPEKAKLKSKARNKSHNRSSSRSNRKLLKKPSRLSVMNRLKKSKSNDYNDESIRSKSKSKHQRSKTKTSRFASLKLSKKEKNKNKNKASTPSGTKSSLTFRNTRKQPQGQIRNHYHQEPIHITRRGSNSSSISVSTGSDSKGADGATRGNLLRANAPDMYATVSADDIDIILDEIEDNEKKQNQVFGKIKGKLIKSYTAHTQRIQRGHHQQPGQQQPGHQRGSSLISTSSSKHKHKHGPHCTHCHHNHNHKPSPSNITKARRPGRAGSAPNVDIDISGGIPWQALTNAAPSQSSKSGRKTGAENVNIIRKIVASKNVDINTQNPRDGTTLIIHTVIIGDFDLFQELLRNGADYLIADYDGDDCIDYALLFQRYKICHLLLMINKRMTEERIYQITKQWGKESKYMANNVFGKFKDNLIDFVCKTIEEKGVIGDDMIFKAWYFTLYSENKVTGNETQPHFSESKLFKIMLKEFGDCMKNRRANRKTWQWIRKYLIQSIIWLLPHPDEQKLIFDEPDSDDSDDESDDDETDVDSDIEPDVNEYESKESKESKGSSSQLTITPIIIKEPYKIPNGKGYGLDGSRHGALTGSRSRTPRGGSPGHNRVESGASTNTTLSTMTPQASVILHEDIQDEYMKAIAMNNYDARKGDKLLLFLFL